MQTDRRQNATAKSVTVIDTDIVKLKQSDFAIASHYLAAAFSQDPLMAHFLPEDEGVKQTALKHFSQALLNYAQIYSHIYTTADYPKGVAIWFPPHASFRYVATAMANCSIGVDYTSVLYALESNC